MIYDMQLTQSTPLNSSVKGSFNDIIFTLCMSCTINLVNSQRRSSKTHYALYRWKEGVALNSICIVKRGKTLSLCGVNSFIFFVFFLVEGSAN